jgi:hypothetical protein
MTGVYVALVVLFVAVALLAWSARAQWQAISSVGARLGNWQPPSTSSSSSSSSSSPAAPAGLLLQPSPLSLGVLA